MDTLVMPGLQKLFIHITNPKQRQYEAVRAIEIDKLSVAQAAKQFNYQTSTLYSLLRDIKAGKIELFPNTTHIKKLQTPPYVVEQIIAHRKQNLSAYDITERICNEGYKISVRTVERILSDANIPKLKRRTHAELGLTRKRQHLPERACAIDFEKLEPFTVDLPVAGVFFFIPYIINSGILEVVNQCELPESSVIHSVQANLSMLLLKLIGNERLFNLNALSSPLMIRIHFDLLWTLIADTLYHRFSQDLPRFQHERANTLFKRFIDMPGKISYDGFEFVVKIRKRAHTPILMGIDSLVKGVSVPWLDNKNLRIVWTA